MQEWDDVRPRMAYRVLVVGERGSEEPRCAGVQRFEHRIAKTTEFLLTRRVR